MGGNPKGYLNLRNTFKDRPENINKGGRPRKTFKAFIDNANDKGIPQVSKKEYMETIGVCMNMTKTELEAIHNDDKQPAWIRWLIADLGNARLRTKIMSDYRDWLFGGAKQEVKVENEGGDVEVFKLGDKIISFGVKLPEKDESKN
jgi:hypothetical protein